MAIAQLTLPWGRIAMMEKFKFGFYLLFFSLFLSACQPTSKLKENSTMNNPQEYVLHFGEQGIQDFIKYSQEDVDHQPASMSFHSLDFSPPNLGQIKIENAANSLVLENVFAVLGTQISIHPKDGIQILDIDAGLTKEEFVSPEKAYQAYVNLMKRMNQAGWKNYFYRFDPRIAKEDNLKYLAENRNIIDPSYIFSFDEWKEVMKKNSDSTYYRLYANGIFLGISLKQTALNERGEEQYMLRYDIQTARYNERNLISNSDEMTASELEKAFKKSIIDDKKYRENEEKKVRAKGYRIDEEYVDPDVWQYVK